MNKTLIICKPDAIERGLVGEIISRLENKGLILVAADLRILDSQVLSSHYAEHVDKSFYHELEDFMTRGPVLVAVVQGPKDTWNIVRNMLGATDPRDAVPGTIRGDFATLLTENLVHGSDSAASAVREIQIFFPTLDL